MAGDWAGEVDEGAIVVGWRAGYGCERSERDRGRLGVRRPRMRNVLCESSRSREREEREERERERQREREKR